jgi:hypothetical protein
MKRCVFAVAAACLSLAFISASAAADTPPPDSAPASATSAPPAEATPAQAAPVAAAPAASPAPATAATSPTMPGSDQAAAGNAVVVYIDPAITDRKWSNQPYLLRPVFLTGELNNVGKEITSRITKVVTSFAPNATVVTSPAQNGGAKFYIVPTIKRLEQISGTFAWDDLSYVIELEWRVTDSHGAVVLLDTVKGEAKGKFGTSFSAAGNATRYEFSMLDQAMSQSEALLKPILADTQAAAAAH